ncbi:MAG TPA: glycosyl transferase family 1, partial [Methylomirabilota bacterium]|nr:glycosyl transferase family 1 [Methylomirabilota bacterium]
MSPRLDDYRQVAPPGAVDIVLKLAERVRGRRFLHVTGGRFGGGPTEVLAAAVPILNDIGVDTRWEITGGDPAFYATSRALHATLEGAERVITDEALGHWTEMNRVNAKKLDLRADLVLVHDVPPAGLVADRAEGRWLWRCHFDASRALRRGWSFFRRSVDQYDAAIFSLPEFGRRLGVPQYVIHPSIDPLSDKNRELSPREVASIAGALGVARDKPLLLQVGPFTQRQDPLGVVNAYRLVKKHHDVRVVLAGTAGDDRE